MRMGPSQIAQTSKAYRLKKVLTQEQLARELGVSFATVNRWESGRYRPQERTGALLAQLAGNFETLNGMARCPVCGSVVLGMPKMRDAEIREMRALFARMLRTKGFSFRQICQIVGWKSPRTAALVCAGHAK